MREIHIFLLDGDEPENIYEKHKNSLYKLKDGKIYFESKVHLTSEEVEFAYKIIELDEDFANQIYKFIPKAIINACDLSEEPITPNIDTIERIKSIIHSKIYKSRYKEKISVFDLATDIFISCLMNHCFQNGNKRFSLCFLILILKSFGFYFKWTGGNEKNYSSHEKTIADFVDGMKNNNIDDINIKKIKEWIESNCVIDIPKK